MYQYTDWSNSTEWIEFSKSRGGPGEWNTPGCLINIEPDPLYIAYKDSALWISDELSKLQNFDWQFQTHNHAATIGNTSKTRIVNAKSEKLRIVNALLGNYALKWSIRKYRRSSPHDEPHPLNLSASPRISTSHSITALAIPNAEQNALHEACENNSIEVVRGLIEHGANTNYATEDKVTALGIAVVHRSCDLVRILIDHGANPDSTSWGQVLFKYVAGIETSI